MRRPGPVARTVISFALWPLIIMFSPVIILAGERASRYVMRRMRRTASTAQIAAVRHDGRPARAAAARLPPGTSLLLAVISHPLWIALTAPGRWVGDRYRRRGRRTGEGTLTACGRQRLIPHDSASAGPVSASAQGSWSTQSRAGPKRATM